MKQKLVLSKLTHTWILDLDGTVVKHNGYKIDDKDTLLPGTKEFFNSIPSDDAVIFLTSRTEEIKAITEKFLQDNGIRYDMIVYGVPMGERILINDNKPSGLCMAKAVALDRDKGMDCEIFIDIEM